MNGTAEVCLTLTAGPICGLGDARIEASYPLWDSIIAAESSLAPRRPGELPHRTPPVAIHGQDGPFNGTYRGEFVQFLDPDAKPMPIELQLERHGQMVTGRYSFGLGFGSVEGRISGQRLRFLWTWAGNYGHGVLDARADGGFSGTWGYREADTGAGTWIGLPSP